MSDDKETELEIAQRAARVIGLPYADDESAADLRARVRAEWTSMFGGQSGAIVPAWLGSVLNENEPPREYPVYITAADLARCVPVLPPSGDGAKEFEALLQESNRQIGDIIRGRYVDTKEGRHR